MSCVFVENPISPSAPAWTEEDQANVMEEMFRSMDELYPDLYDVFIPFIATLPPISMDLADIFQKLAHHIGYNRFDRSKPVSEVFKDMDHFLKVRIKQQY